MGIEENISFLHIMQRFRRLNLSSLFGNITRGEFFVMDMLLLNEQTPQGADGMYVSDLVARTKNSPPGVSRTLKALEQKGYLQRHVDSQNRRNTFIRLTPEGRHAVCHAKQQFEAFIARICATMGEDEIRQFLALFERLLHIIESEIGQIPEPKQEKEAPCSES